MRFESGQRVSWLNASSETESGVVTKVAGSRVYVEMRTIGGKPRAKWAYVFFEGDERSKLTIRKELEGSGE